jgi:hypothetical protein
MKAAGTDGRLLLGHAGSTGDIGVYSVCGTKWTDVAKTDVKAAQNLWIYEVVVLGGVARIVLSDAVATRQVFKTVTITFPARVVFDSDPCTRVIVESGTDAFTDVVFFERDCPEIGRPFERFYFVGTADENHKPRVRTVAH